MDFTLCVEIVVIFTENFIFLYCLGYIDMISSNPNFSHRIVDCERIFAIFIVSLAVFIVSLAGE